MGIVDIILMFFIYAVLGWFVEVIYRALNNGSFINPGFLNGPWCPIYGFGVIGVITLLEPFRNNPLTLFIGAVVVTTLIELVTGFLLEQLFYKKWWDYSNRPFNIGGYICLLFSIGWGLASMLVVEFIHPQVLNLMDITPNILAIVLIIVLMVLLIVDLAVTVNTIFKLNRKLEYLAELTDLIRNTSNEMGGTVANGVFHLSDLKEGLENRIEIRRQSFYKSLDKHLFLKFEEILRKMRTQDWPEKETQLEELKEARQELLEIGLSGEHRLIRAFPRLDAKEHQESLRTLKALYNLRQQKRKKRKQGNLNGKVDE